MVTAVGHQSLLTCESWHRVVFEFPLRRLLNTMLVRIRTQSAVRCLSRVQYADDDVAMEGLS